MRACLATVHDQNPYSITERPFHHEASLSPATDVFQIIGLLEAMLHIETYRGLVVDVHKKADVRDAVLPQLRDALLEEEITPPLALARIIDGYGVYCRNPVHPAPLELQVQVIGAVTDDLSGGVLDDVEDRTLYRAISHYGRFISPVEVLPIYLHHSIEVFSVE